MTDKVSEMFDQYLQFVLLTENTPDSLPQDPKFIRGLHGAMGMADEAQEIAQLFKKFMFGKHKPIQRYDLVNELGDLFWYMTLLMEAYDISFEEMIEYNRAKLTKRYVEPRGEYIHLPKNTENERKAHIAVEPFTTWLPSEEQDRLRQTIVDLLGG